MEKPHSFNISHKKPVDSFKSSIKTSFLSSGNRLHVVNLSQQSDAVDLLGGYKPFDSLLLLKQIYRDFCHEQNNNEYIEEVQVKFELFRFGGKLSFSRNLFKLNDIKKLFD